MFMQIYVTYMSHGAFKPHNFSKKYNNTGMPTRQIIVYEHDAGHNEWQSHTVIDSHWYNNYASYSVYVSDYSPTKWQNYGLLNTDAITSNCVHLVYEVLSIINMRWFW